MPKDDYEYPQPKKYGGKLIRRPFSVERLCSFQLINYGVKIPVWKFLFIRLEGTNAAEMWAR
jgi:hypothetical protein